MAKKAKKDVVKIPWDKEEKVQGKSKFKEGDYPAKIVSAKFIRSKEKDTPGIEVEFKITDGKYKGKKITETLWIRPKALPRLRDLCKVVGIKTGKKPEKLDLSKFKGKELGISIEDDIYERNGKKVKGSSVAYEGFMSIEDLESGGVDDDEDDTDDSDTDDDSTDVSEDSEDTSDDDSDDTTDSDVSIDSDSL